MKKTLLFLLCLLPVYLGISLSFLDKEYILCPIKYPKNIIIRVDSRGSGYFSAERNGNRVHRGIDLLADIGSPVMAARSGRVIISTSQPNGMGLYVVIQHPRGVTTLYGHLSKIYVRKGQLVRQGQVIGAVGRTGNANHSSILPHLHFELRENNIPRDPLQYLD